MERPAKFRAIVYKQKGRNIGGFDNFPFFILVRPFYWIFFSGGGIYFDNSSILLQRIVFVTYIVVLSFEFWFYVMHYLENVYSNSKNLVWH